MNDQQYDVDWNSVDQYANGPDPTAQQDAARDPQQAAAATDPGIAGGMNGGETVPPSDNLSPFPNPGFASGTSIPGDTAEPSVVAAAAGVPGYATDGSGGGPITRLDGTGGPLSGTPALPNPGTGGTGAQPGAANAPGQTLTDAQWKQDFESKFGYFDPRFNSREHMLANAQRGDTEIAPQMQYMAGLDASAAQVEGAIAQSPDFYRSQNAFNWGAQHNQEIQQRVAAGEFAQNAGRGAPGPATNGPLSGSPQAGGGRTQNIAALDAIQRQQWQAPSGGPIDNAHALMTEQMRTGIADSLVALGVDPKTIKQGFDPYGNLTLDWTSKSGTPMQIKESLVNYASALQQLRDAAAQQQDTTPPGSAPSRGAPPRYAPPTRPATPPPAQAPPEAPGMAATPGYQAATGPGGFPDLYGTQPFNNAGRQQFPVVRPLNIPGGVNY